jgi:hypothetical protein
LDVSWVCPFRFESNDLNVLSPAINPNRSMAFTCSFIRPGQQAAVPNLPSTAAHTVPQPETGLIAAATPRASAESRKRWRVSYSIRIGFFQTIV